MSIHQMSLVWQLDLPHSKAWVLLALADHADDYGKNCFPSVPHLAWKTGYSERQVQRIMKVLTDDGLIKPVAFMFGGRGNATEYHLHLEKGDKKSPFVNPEKGDISRKGDISGQERVTFPAEKGDTAMSPTTGEEPSREPSVRIYELGVFKNVRLSADAYKQLTQELGPDVRNHYIESLSEYMASKRKRYDNHFATIRAWVRKDKRKGEFPPITTQPNRTKNGERKFDPNE